MSKLPFIAALLLAFASGCLAETDGEDDGAIEELLVDDGHSPDGHAPDVHGDEPVHIPTDATTQRHDPPPNPWQPDEGLSYDDDDPTTDIQQLPELEFEIPR